MVLAINDRCAPDTKKTGVLILLVVTTYDTFTTIFNVNNNKISIHQLTEIMVYLAYLAKLLPKGRSNSKFFELEKAIWLVIYALT